MNNMKEVTENNQVEKITETKPKKKKTNKIITIVVAALVIGLVIFRIASSMAGPEPEQESIVTVKTALAEKMSINTTSPITGRVEPIDEVSIIPLASGKITAVYADIGDKVSKGATLFQIDGTQLSTTYNQAKEGLNVAKSSYDRLSALYKEGAVAYQDYEKAQSAYLNAQQTLTAASDALGNCTVTSPINGYITSKQVEVGGIASPAAPAMTVADVSKLQINTNVAEYIVNDLKVGDTVDVYIASLGKQAYKGVIDAISPAPASGNLTYPVKISISDNTGAIKAGMFAEIRIISEEKNNTLCVPSDSVIMKEGTAVVVTLGKGNTPKYNKVKTGIDNGDYVEILSGLKEGDTIVISGQQYVTEGTPVHVSKK
ncbi:efflux RND transporter periplasmic adaptor subunit [Aminipila terrae]|uniref:Efflux RND transporter periplasmic adaptor subunit n=2 Tax=Aminipila terrae TaxID=2697030 RepID=A0A6P1MHB3_9FIRM|nr:efflux RND transporter periplasmic adaptor subunit [Aminipila terrae]